MKRTSDSEVNLAAAMACGRQILASRFRRGREAFSTDRLRDSLAENGSFVNSVIAAFAAEGLIEEQKSEEPQGVSAGLFGLTPATYRISSRILEEVVTTHLGLTIDETRQTIQRPGVCRHVVTLSPVQLRLAVAMCDAGEAGIMPSMVTSLRGGETTGERQLRTAFNRILSVLGVKLGRFAWKIVEK